MGPPNGNDNSSGTKAHRLGSKPQSPHWAAFQLPPVTDGYVA